MILFRNFGGKKYLKFAIFFQMSQITQNILIYTTLRTTARWLELQRRKSILNECNECFELLFSKLNLFASFLGKLHILMELIKTDF